MKLVGLESDQRWSLRHSRSVLGLPTFPPHSMMAPRKPRWSTWRPGQALVLYIYLLFLFRAIPLLVRRCYTMNSYMIYRYILLWFQFHIITKNKYPPLTRNKNPRTYAQEHKYGKCLTEYYTLMQQKFFMKILTK